MSLRPSVGLTCRLGGRQMVSCGRTASCVSGPCVSEEISGGETVPRCRSRRAHTPVQKPCTSTERWRPRQECKSLPNQTQLDRNRPHTARLFLSYPSGINQERRSSPSVNCVVFVCHIWHSCAALLSTDGSFVCKQLDFVLTVKNEMFLCRRLSINLKVLRDPRCVQTPREPNLSRGWNWAGGT